jgi:PST family polysaccharide transporter
MQGKIAAGAALSFVYRLIDRSLGIVSTIVLARLLMPEDFGLVAMSAAVLAVIALATGFGFELALVQHPAPERHHYNSAWTLNVLLGVGAASVVCALAYPAALFFGEPRVVGIMLLSALTLALGGFENVGLVEFRRKMDFVRDAAYLSAKRLIGFAVTLVLALLLESYWALPLGALASCLGGLALSYAMHPMRPRFGLAAWRQLVHFSRWTLLSNLLIAGLQRAPQFLVGRDFGSASLGHYVMASDIGGLPTNEVAAPLTRAAVAGFARVAADGNLLVTTFLGINALAALLVIPAGTGLALVAEPAVDLLLGSRWEAAVPLLQILAVSGVMVALTANFGSLCIAVGRPQSNMAMLALRLAALVTGLLLLPLEFGLQGAAMAELAASAVALLSGFLYARRLASVRPFQVLRGWWRPLLASAVMYPVVTASLHATAASGSFLRLLAAASAGATSYVAAVAILWLLCGRPDGAEARLTERLVAVLKRNRSPR